MANNTGGPALQEFHSRGNHTREIEVTLLFKKKQLKRFPRAISISLIELKSFQPTASHSVIREVLCCAVLQELVKAVYKCEENCVRLNFNILLPKLKHSSSFNVHTISRFPNPQPLPAQSHFNQQVRTISHKASLSGFRSRQSNNIN